MTDVHGGGLGTYWEGVRPAAVAHGGDVRVALKVRVTRCYFELCWCCKQLLIPCVAGNIRVLCYGIEVRMDVFRFGQLGLCPPSMIAASSIYLVLCVNVFWLQFRNIALSGQG